MRGKPISDAPSTRIWGITPADAGKTCSATNSAKTSWDHPRGCGENHFASTIFCAISGSPPQVRGKRREGIVAACNVRITPAGAGKTHRDFLKQGFTQDHPRRCGENYFLPKKGLTRTGSPPRMRGKLSFLCDNNGEIRITPAHAGKTYHAELFSGKLEDHPRACGENFQVFYLVWGRCGSPPRMRGKRFCSTFFCARR